MITTGQEKLNKKEVSKGIWRFFFSFVALTGFTFLAVFLFYKSSEQQELSMRKEVESYQNILKKNEILLIKVDEIYRKMSMIGNGKSVNENILNDDIAKYINECKGIIDKDSVKEFKQYATLLKNTGEMSSLKSKIISKQLEKDAINRNIEMCNGQLKSVEQMLINATPKPKVGPRVGSRVEKK